MYVPSRTRKRMGRYVIMLLAIIITVCIVHGEDFYAGNDSAHREVPTREIFNKLISNKDVDYSNKIIVGDLTLMKPPFNNISIINSSIRIINSEVRGQLYFEDIVFCQDLNFSGTVMVEKASFVNAKFIKNALFNNTNFKKGVNFGTTQFNGKAYFQGSVINEGANFYNISFKNIGSFADSKITKANVANSKFSKDAIFTGTEFYNDALMHDITFSSGAYFVSSKFHGKTYFQRSTFNGSQNAAIKRSCSFLGAKFLDDAYFDDAVFRRDVTFKNSRFLENAYFEKTKFNDDTDFINVKFQNDAIFWNSQFNKSLSLNYTKFSCFKAQWKDLEGHLLFGEILYQSLIKNFKDLGRTDDANDCYYDYRIKKSYNLEFPAKMVDTAIRVSCGYGVRPSYTLLVCILMISFFAIVIWWKRGINWPNKKNDWEIIHQIKFSKNLRYVVELIFNAYLLRCLYFSTAVFINSKPDDIFIREKDKRLITRLVTLERILGWIFFGLFIATTTRMMIGS